MHEVTLFVDECGDGTLAAWSLGLRKFGRPDIVVLGIAARRHATETALVLRDLASHDGGGRAHRAGRSRSRRRAARRSIAARFDPASAPIVAVEGDAIVLRAIEAATA